MALTVFLFPHFVHNHNEKTLIQMFGRYLDFIPPLSLPQNKRLHDDSPYKVHFLHQVWWDRLGDDCFTLIQF